MGFSLPHGNIEVAHDPLERRGSTVPGLTPSVRFLGNPQPVTSRVTKDSAAAEVSTPSSSRFNEQSLKTAFDRLPRL